MTGEHGSGGACGSDPGVTAVDGTGSLSALLSIVVRMALRRMDHVGVVVDDLEAAIAFFVELGMELVGEAPVEGRWVDRVVALDDVRVDVAFVRTPDGHGQLELTKFHNPAATTAEPDAPANTLGLRRMGVVERIGR